MICSKCGLIKLEEDNFDMYICENCSTIFCLKCMEKEGYKCTNEDCKSSKIKVLNSDLNYLIFDQDFRRIKKGGFG